MKLGVFIDGVPWTGTSQVDQFAQRNGQTDAVHWFQNASSPLPAWPVGRAALLTYEPWEWADQGALRANVTMLARKLAANKKVTFLRFGHEMNGNWYPWCGDPKTFQFNWRQLVTALKAAGAWDFTFLVWCPNETDVGGTKLEAYYPGNELVDYIGVDGYNWGPPTAERPWARWRSFDSIFVAPVNRLRQLATKRIVVCETACAPTGGDRRRWLADALATRLPIVTACYFNKNKELAWAI